MMFDLIMLFLGAFLMSSAIAYACWASVRVTFLRQELFAIRDRLWDETRILGAFNDPAYQETRQHLNAAIRISGLFSAQAFDAWNASGNVRKLEGHSRLLSQNIHLQAAIDHALEASSTTIIRFAVLYRLSGLAWLAKSTIKHIFSRSRKHADTGFTTPTYEQSNRVRPLIQSSFSEQISEFERVAKRYSTLSS